VINGSSSDRIFTTGLGVGLGRGESATFNNLTLSNGHDTFGGGRHRQLRDGSAK